MELPEAIVGEDEWDQVWETPECLESLLFLKLVEYALKLCFASILKAVRIGICCNVDPDPHPAFHFAAI